MSWKTASRLLLGAACGCAGVCQAQFRDGPAVMAPPPAAAVPRQDDIAPSFQDAYRAARSPRIALLWNRELNDKTQSTASATKTIRDSGSASSNGLQRTTQEPLGSATLRDGGVTFERTRTETSSHALDADADRSNRLSARNATLLQRVFVDEMNRGGVHFVDRALAMRMTAAAAHRQGGDPKLIEADALIAHADLLLEVLMIDDREAPCGYGFDVRVKDLRRGVEIASVYSIAMPHAPAPRPGNWIAGASDYVFEAPPAPPAPTAGELGAALARDVMFTLSASLEAERKVPERRRSK